MGDGIVIARYPNLLCCHCWLCANCDDVLLYDGWCDSQVIGDGGDDDGDEFVAVDFVAVLLHGEALSLVRPFPNHLMSLNVVYPIRHC